MVHGPFCCPPGENQDLSHTKATDNPQQAVSTVRDKERRQDSSQHEGVSVNISHHSNEGRVSCLC